MSQRKVWLYKNRLQVWRDYRVITLKQAGLCAVLWH